LPLQVSLDVMAWALALVLAMLARYDLAGSAVWDSGLAVVILAAAVLQVGIGLLSGLYRGLMRFGSFDEVAVLAPATVGASLVLFAVSLASGSPRLVPLSVPLIAGVIAFVLMGGVRYGWRLLLDRRLRPTGEEITRLLVFGAGEAGVQVVEAMLRNPESRYLPVALLDDDPRRRRLRILGVPVAGNRYAIGDAARRYQAGALLVALPSAGGQLIGELTDLANAAGLELKVLPPLAELLDDRVEESDIRDISEADLLGRHEVDIDVAAIAGYLTGRRVLVTGAGGSIGSELCRQVARYAPAELIKLDRDESALHAVQLSIEGRALLDGDDLVLLDIRDRQRLDRLFAERRPEVVFHAAALKHLPLLESHPDEAVKTNVVATGWLLEAAEKYGVERFVNISTDKAADPTSVLGYSKRIAEMLTAHFARRAVGTYVSVRFGNVLGSRGSVLTSFHSQIAAGGPITVTHPEVTRYFMTVPEAVQLVVQAGAIDDDGAALVLDMGTPVRIASVAERLAAQSGKDISIVYTGLRPGEKLHEVLLGHGEPDIRPVHPLISHVPVPPCSPKMASVDLSLPHAGIVAQLQAISCGPPARHREPAYEARLGA
jgi:FlaA1/EpsC-like NDP-sugar epimerase